MRKETIDPSTLQMPSYVLFLWSARAPPLFPAPTHLTADGIPSVHWGPLGAPSELSVAAYSAMSVLDRHFPFSLAGLVKRSQTPW